MQRLQITLGQAEHLTTAGDPALDEVDEAGAGHRGDLGVAGGGERVLVGVRGDGRPGADHADAAVAGGGDRAAHRGQDHFDNGHVVAFPRVPKTGGRGRVARDHQGLDAPADQIVTDGQRVRADLRNGQRAIGAVAGVADVDDVLIGQLVDDRPRDGEPTDAGVEDPDGRQWRTR